MAFNTSFVTLVQPTSKRPQHIVTCTLVHPSTLGTPQGTKVYKVPGSEKLKCATKLSPVIFANCTPDIVSDNALSWLLMSQSQGNPDEDGCHKGKYDIQLVVKRTPERKLIGKLPSVPL